MSERGKTIVISLVSQQAAPNAMFLKHRKMRQMDDFHILVTTQKMERYGRSQNLISTIFGGSFREREDFVRLELSDTDINNVESIRTKVKEIVETYAREKGARQVILHATGGTKMMAMAAWWGCMGLEGEGIEVLLKYIPEGESRILSIGSAGRSLDEELLGRDSALTVEEYLGVYGIEVENKDPVWSDRRRVFCDDRTKARRMLELFMDSSLEEDVAAFVKNAVDFRHDKKTVSWDEWGETDRRILGRLNFEANRVFKKEEIRWLSGEWLEEYVADLLEDLRTEDQEISPIYKGVRVKYPQKGTAGTGVGDTGTDNEIDVMFIRRNTLYVFECKSALKDEQGENLFNDSIYKLQALRHRFGLTPRMVFVTPDQGMFEAGGENIRSKWKKRADDFGVMLITRKELVDKERFRAALRLAGDTGRESR